MTNNIDYTRLSREIGLTAVAPSINLRGRVVVITGGADGIGGALTRAAHLYGAKVVAIDVQGDKLRDLKIELGDRFFGVKRNLIHPMDAGFRDALAEVCGRFGKVDAYVMNAGAIKLFDKTRAKDLISTPAQELRDLMQLNALSHLEMFQVLHPYLMKSDAGRVVTTSSPIVGRNDLHTLGYALSKRALGDIAFHMQKQMEGTNVLVSGYVPPPVQNWLRADLKNEPFGANALPQDIIELPLRLMSADLLAVHNGKMFVYVDKRSDVRDDAGKLLYQFNQRTENGLDLGIRTRPLNIGGGIEGSEFIKSYDTWNSRQLAECDPIPPIDAHRPLLTAFAPPAYIAAHR